MDNIKTWTGFPVEESTRMTEDKDKWRKYVHGVTTGVDKGAGGPAPPMAGQKRFFLLK